MKHAAQVTEKLKMLPDEPGVYMMRDARRKVIYIGKATSLRSRVRHYFQDATYRTADPKLRGLISSIHDLDFIVTRSEAEAAITESQFIKDFKPRYNILLKDDKRFLLIRIDVQHPFPVIKICRLEKKDGALYFGPFTNSTAARATCEFMEQRFRLRQCRPLRPNAETYKHCLNDIIRMCSAPCVGKISETDYRKQVDEVVALLRGERPAYLRELHAAMEEASSALQFERAAALRDTYLMLKQTTRERAKVQKSIILKKQEATQGIHDLQRELALPTLPRVIETFDISNISGTHAVASMVTAVNGLPDRKRYRHFRIKTVEGPNDPAMMAEAVHRRYSRLQQEQAALPDLVLVDGGITQVNAARAVLNALNLHHLPVAGLAKRYEEIHQPDQSPVSLPLESCALLVLRQIRDEAHRFAITYHRHLRARVIRESELDDVSGIGKKRKQALLQHFGSVQRIKKASIEDLAAVSGFGVDSAKLLYAHFHPLPEQENE